VFTPQAIFDLISERRLLYEHTTQTGVIVHMLSGIGSSGRLGLTAIGSTRQQAEEIYQRFITTLDQAAQ
jgi:hypothetical protein